jgi:hypothetical protein
MEVVSARALDPRRVCLADALPLGRCVVSAIRSAGRDQEPPLRMTEPVVPRHHMASERNHFVIDTRYTAEHTD